MYSKFTSSSLYVEETKTFRIAELFPLRLQKLVDHHQCKAQQTKNRLGLCDIYLFYRLLSQRLNCFTNLGQTPLNRSQ